MLFSSKERIFLKRGKNFLEKEEEDASKESM